MKLTPYRVIVSQLTPVPPVVTDDLSGKTVVVVGASNGLGLEAAKHFARMKPGRLILACRSQKRGEAALAQLANDETCKDAPAELWLVDLVSFDSIKAFCERFENDGGRLDILLLNAGIIPAQTLEMTSDDWEPTFQTNVLSTSLLGLLLLPRMVETAEKYRTTPRTVVVTSGLHHQAKIAHSDIMDLSNPLDMFGSEGYFTEKVKAMRYNDTKLLNVFFARGLTDRLGDKPLIVNTVCPGYCYSNIRSSLRGLTAWFNFFLEKAVARTTDQGARQLIWGALGGKGQEERLRGAYISNTNIEEPSDFVLSPEGLKAQNLLFDDLIRVLSKVELKIEKIVDQYLTQKV